MKHFNYYKDYLANLVKPMRIVFVVRMDYADTKQVPRPVIFSGKSNTIYVPMTLIGEAADFVFEIKDGVATEIKDEIFNKNAFAITEPPNKEL